MLDLRNSETYPIVFEVLTQNHKVLIVWHIQILKMIAKGLGYVSMDVNVYTLYNGSYRQGHEEGGGSEILYISNDHKILEWLFV